MGIIVALAVMYLIYVLLKDVINRDKDTRDDFHKQQDEIMYMRNRKAFLMVVKDVWTKEEIETEFKDLFEFIEKHKDDKKLLDTL